VKSYDVDRFDETLPCSVGGRKNQPTGRSKQRAKATTSAVSMLRRRPVS
jgi:hypothetical protein